MSDEKLAQRRQRAEQACRLIRDASRCLIPGEFSDVDAVDRDLWIALHLVETAIRKPTGGAASAVLKFIEKSAKLAEMLHDEGDGWAYTLERWSKQEKVEFLHGMLRDALEDVEGPSLPHWWRAYEVFQEFTLFFWDNDIHAEQDGLQCEPESTLRFLARLIRTLPKRDAERLENHAAAADADLRSRAQFDAAKETLLDGVEEGWGWVLTPHRDASWFLNRALEAMNENPNEVRAFERMRAARERERMRAARGRGEK